MTRALHEHASRQLELLALRSLELADRVAAGEIAFLDAIGHRLRSRDVVRRHGDGWRRHRAGDACSGFRKCAEADVTDLRPYQHKIISDLERASASGGRRTVITMPTGSGKTEVAAAIIKQAVASRNGCWCSPIPGKLSSRLP
jgi:hypothetical protein